MPSPETILSNIAAFAAFDAARARGADVEAIASPYLVRILYEPDSARRRKQLDALLAALFLYFSGTIVRQALKVGEDAAGTILRRPEVQDIPNPIGSIQRRQDAAGLRARKRDRIAIVSASLLSAVTRLRTALDRFWLEPGTTTRQQRINALARRYLQQQAKLTEYRAALAESIRRGETRRPTKPKLELWPEMIADIAIEFRSQARRIAAEEELANYAAIGFTEYTWVTVNGRYACPDCQGRAGITGPIEYFLIVGLPRDGSTVCRDYCYCHLYPSAIVPPGFRVNYSIGVNPSGGFQSIFSPII